MDMTEIPEILFKHKKLLYCEDGQTLEGLAQGVCGVSIFAGSQNTTGNSPEKPAVPYTDLSSILD